MRASLRSVAVPLAAGLLLALATGARAQETPAAGAVPTRTPPVDRNHHLGPGDVLEISVNGLDLFRRTVRLFTDGTFDYPLVGTVQAAGLTTRELENRLAEALKAQLRRPVVSVTLKEIYVPPPPPAAEKKIPRITVLGAATRKGILELPEPRYLRTILAEIGPTERADLSRIRVRYPDGSARTADFSEFLRKGESPDDFLIRGGEEIILLELPPPPPPRGPEFVRIDGQVANPGQQELKPGMTLQDLILAAGKLTVLADVERVQLERKGGSRETINLLELQKRGLDGRVFLQPGDYVFVPARASTVMVIGAIPNPGPKGLEPGQRVSDFFLQGHPDLAAALNPAAVDTGGVQLLRKGQPPVKIDLLAVVKRPERKDNVALQSGDVLFLPPKREKGKSALDYIGQLGPLGFLFGLF